MPKFTSSSEDRESKKEKRKIKNKSQQKKFDEQPKIADFEKFHLVSKREASAIYIHFTIKFLSQEI
jgi:hypothetical protein